MTMKLVQKTFLKGSRKFEIANDTLFINSKSFFKHESLTVDLSTVNSEPVKEGKELIFYSDYKGRPIFSMWLNKPDTKSFNAFVDAIKHSITGDDESAISEGIEADISESVREEALSRNVYEEPPEFSESSEMTEKTPFAPVNAERLKDDIGMLKTYMDGGENKVFLDALELLMMEPDNEIAFEKMLSHFSDLGFYQGAVLTYAPYIKVLVSNSIQDLERLGGESYVGVKGD